MASTWYLHIAVEDDIFDFDFDSYSSALEFLLDYVDAKNLLRKSMNKTYSTNNHSRFKPGLLIDEYGELVKRNHHSYGAYSITREWI